jgi:hypothetical protein
VLTDPESLRYIAIGDLTPLCLLFVPFEHLKDFTSLLESWSFIQWLETWSEWEEDLEESISDIELSFSRYFEDSEKVNGAVDDVFCPVK